MFFCEFFIACLFHVWLHRHHGIRALFIHPKLLCATLTLYSRLKYKHAILYFCLFIFMIIMIIIKLQLVHKSLVIILYICTYL